MRVRSARMGRGYAQYGDARHHACAETDLHQYRQSYPPGGLIGQVLSECWRENETVERRKAYHSGKQGELDDQPAAIGSLQRRHHLARPRNKHGVCYTRDDQRRDGNAPDAGKARQELSSPLAIVSACSLRTEQPRKKEAERTQPHCRCEYVSNGGGLVQPALQALTGRGMAGPGETRERCGKKHKGGPGSRLPAPNQKRAERETGKDGAGEETQGRIEGRQNEDRSVRREHLTPRVQDRVREDQTICERAECKQTATASQHQAARSAWFLASPEYRS